MFGALASSVDLSTKDVLAPIGAVCGGVIAAFVAWFNARQTPSDRLQALLTIYKDWPDNVPGQKCPFRLKVARDCPACLGFAK
jgi:hypothetical protein